MRISRLLLLPAVVLASGCVYYYPGPPPYGYGPPPLYERRGHRHSLDDPAAVEDRPTDRNAGSPSASVERVDPPPPAGLPNHDGKNQPPAKAESQGEIPTAVRGSVAGRVKSPFQPNREIDVSGLPGGSLAKDPFTGKVFRVP
jgi:hypothetical protein